MDWKRHYFKLEMEQLPEHIWAGFKYSEVFREMKVREKSEIIQQIERLPEAKLDRLRDAIELVWRESDRKLMAEKLDGFAPVLLGETALVKDWLSTEEDEAWKDL
ncbi:MAG: hypothetical protein F6J93_39715 [Oscillatoria sp. SIO1A7]|nr:hypothetical protein [Oscillatoria sp. SIO1A7]